MHNAVRSEGRVCGWKDALIASPGAFDFPTHVNTNICYICQPFDDFPNLTPHPCPVLGVRAVLGVRVCLGIKKGSKRNADSTFLFHFSTTIDLFAPLAHNTQVGRNTSIMIGIDRLCSSIGGLKPLTADLKASFLTRGMRWPLRQLPLISHPKS